MTEMQVGIGEMGRRLMRSRALLAGIAIGVPIGCLVALAAVGLIQESEHPRTMTFGNVEVNALFLEKDNDPEKEYLLLRKDGKAFLWAARTIGGEVTEACLTNGPDQILLTLKSSSKRVEWVSAQYGRRLNGTNTGTFYRDIDFDGHFDVRLGYNDDGRVVSREIDRNGIWVTVNRLKEREANAGADVYTFQPHSGWRRGQSDNP
jgi:hypothetical protein